MNANALPRLKIVILGDSGVGKSAILLRFSEDRFAPSFITTVGIDYKIRTIEIDGEKIRLQIWDTAGQERFRTITTAFYRSAMGVVLVYDVTDSKTFENLNNWIHTTIKEHLSNVDKALVGNKADMNEARVVPADKGKALADENGMLFFEASAKNSTNIEDIFSQLARQIKTRVDLEKKDAPPIQTDKNPPDIGKKPEQASNGCSC